MANIFNMIRVYLHYCNLFAEDIPVGLHFSVNGNFVVRNTLTNPVEFKNYYEAEQYMYDMLNSVFSSFDDNKTMEVLRTILTDLLQIVKDTDIENGLLIADEDTDLYYYHSMLIESLACYLFITGDGNLNYKNAAIFNMKTGYDIKIAESDSFGPLTSVVATSKFIVLFG